MKTDFNVIQSDIRSTKESMQDLNSKWDEMEARSFGIEDRLITAEGKVTALSGMQKELTLAQEIHQNILGYPRIMHKINSLDKIIWKFRVYLQPMARNLYSLLKSLCTVVGYKLYNTDIDTIHRVTLSS